MPSIDIKLGLHRMIKNYYFPGWQQPSTLFELMINLKKWEALPVAQKAQVEAVCGDNIRYGLAEGEAAQFKALKKLRSEGVAIRRWPGEVLDALKAARPEVVAGRVHEGQRGGAGHGCGRGGLKKIPAGRLAVRSRFVVHDNPLKTGRLRTPKVECKPSACKRGTVPPQTKNPDWCHPRFLRK